MQPPSPLVLEAEILLHTAGRSGDDDALKKVIAAGPDWSLVIRLAEWEGVTAPVWRRLSPLVGPAARDALSPLRKLAMVNDFRQARLEQLLGSSLDALSRAGIEAVLLKGAALASTMYPSFSERPMADIDLLVDAESGRQAHRLLIDAGWVLPPGSFPDASYDHHQHLAPLDDAQPSGIGMELHTNLFPDGHPFVFGSDDIMRASRAVPWGRRSVRVPSPEHMVLHACVHFAWSHLMRRGTWRLVRDLSVLASSEVVDWEAVTRQALSVRAGSSCYWTFRLAAPYTGPLVPERLLEQLRPAGSERLHRRLEQHYRLHLLPNLTRCPSLRLERMLWEAGVRPVKSGHGDARPWDHNHEFRRTADPRPSLWKNIARQKLALKDWSRYVRAVI